MRTKQNREAHSLPHLMTRIFGTPLAMEPYKAEVIAHVVGQRMGVEVQAEALEVPTRLAGYYDQSDRKPYEVIEGIAVIDISGTIVNRDNGMSSYSGMTSYEQLCYEVTDAATDPQIKGIILRLNSPGGEVHGMFDAADNIVAASKLKPLWCSVDDMAFSAGYCLAAACKKIYTTRTSGVGSIGVIAMRLDMTEYDKEAGLKYNVIKAGARKADTNPHTPYTKEAREALQAEVDRIYGLFTGFVAKQRKMTVEAVVGTEAGLVWGEEAVAAGLSDGQATFSEVFQKMRAEVSTQSSRTSYLSSSAALTSAVNELSASESIPASLPEASITEPDNTTDNNIVQNPSAHTTLPLTNETEATTASQSKEKETVADTNTQTSNASVENPVPTPAPATTSTENTQTPAAVTAPAPVTTPALEPAPAAVAPSTPSDPIASADEVEELCMLAGINDIQTIREVRAKKLTSAQLRSELVKMRAESQTPSATRSHVTPKTSTGKSLLADLDQQAKTLAESKGITKEKAFTDLLSRNPQAYVEYMASRRRVN